MKVALPINAQEGCNVPDNGKTISCIATIPGILNSFGMRRRRNPCSLGCSFRDTGRREHIICELLVVLLSQVHSNAGSLLHY